MILVWEHWKFLEKLSARERVIFGQMIVLANLIEVSILHSEKQDCLFNWPDSFSVPKRIKSCSQPERLVQKMVRKLLVGC